MAKPVTLPFVTEDAYVAETGAARRTLIAAERVEGPPPLAFPAGDAAFYGAQPLAYDFPAVTWTTYADALLRGHSNIVTPPQAIVRHGLSTLTTEALYETFYSRLMLSRDPRTATWAADDAYSVSYLAEAAVFLDGLSMNYAHWMTEVLPRVAVFVRDLASWGVPLVVDRDLHANIQRSLRLVAGPDAVIHPIAEHEAVRVGVLHNISPTGYVPFKVGPQPVEAICQGLFSPAALRATVARLREAVGDTGPGRERPKVLLRRQGKLRNVGNEGDIAEALANRGFMVVDPERLTLDEQVRLYGQAGMVVGATGAAMTNVIFGRPDCPTVVMMPRFRHTAYWYWRRMAAAAGAGPVLHVSGEQLAPTEDPFHELAVHGDFRVEVQDVLDAVEAAEALRR